MLSFKLGGIELLFGFCKPLGAFGISLGGGSTSGTVDETAVGIQKTDATEVSIQSQEQAKISKSLQESQQAQTQDVKTAGSTASELQQMLTTLDIESQEQLSALLSAVASPEDVGDISGALSERALAADTELQSGIEAIIASARTSGEKEVGRSVTAAGRGAGSTLNSIVQQLGLEGQVDLETKLAGLEAELGLQARQIATSELQGASQQQVAGATSLAQVLKGATQETATTQTQETEQTQLTNALTELVATTSTEDLMTALTEALSQKQQTEAYEEAIEGTTTGKTGGAGFSFGS